ncbi:MAG: monooxygenase [Gammaproteobacteria bacterium]|nr:monooxygenase [Gammaproteobacteria bacterium]
MRAVIVGAGPAGLYAGIALRMACSDMEIRIVERNAADATFGFGVVFSDTALSFLQEHDPETCATIIPAMQSWQDMTVQHAGEHITIDGVGFSAIGRLELLRLLQTRARALSIEPEYGTTITHLGELGTADLIIGADGINSIVRGTLGEAFEEHIELGNNWYAWFGCEKPFATLTQTFTESEFGRFNAHHYRYSLSRSTFIAECGSDTFINAGFDQLDSRSSRLRCEQIFADVLDGTGLIENASTWRRFPFLTTKRWHHGRCVIVGDAAHTAHFSIGSGTWLALEDIQTLVKALKECEWDIPSALALYESQRRPIVEKIVRAAHASAQWYKDFAGHMELDPWSFALSYIQRTGRVDAKWLSRTAPRFAEALQQRGLL